MCSPDCPREDEDSPLELLPAPYPDPAPRKPRQPLTRMEVFCLIVAALTAIVGLGLVASQPVGHGL